MYTFRSEYFGQSVCQACGSERTLSLNCHSNIMSNAFLPFLSFNVGRLYTFYLCLFVKLMSLLTTAARAFVSNSIETSLRRATKHAFLP